MEALQRMGCRHVLHNYWLGHTAGPGRPSGGVSSGGVRNGGAFLELVADRELQYEAAWRLGQWELPMPHLPIHDACGSVNDAAVVGGEGGAISGPLGALGFHASVFG